MNKDIAILPHHLDTVISKYYFSDKWEETLRRVEEQHGKRMVDNVKGVVKGFFGSAEVKVVIDSPDSVCNPGLSAVCRKCIASYSIDAYPEVMDSDKADCKRYQLERISKDGDYRKIMNIVLVLDEVTLLLYYGLEPKKYSPGFLIDKIESTAKKIKKDCPSACRPTQIGYSRHRSIAIDFPDVYKLTVSRLYEDFIDRVVDEHIEKREITSEELSYLKKEYGSLFATVGSDRFYYEVLNIIKR